MEPSRLKDAAPEGKGGDKLRVDPRTGKYELPTGWAAYPPKPVPAKHPASEERALAVHPLQFLKFSNFAFV